MLIQGYRAAVEILVGVGCSTVMYQYRGNMKLSDKLSYATFSSWVLLPILWFLFITVSEYTFLIVVSDSVIQALIRIIVSDGNNGRLANATMSSRCRRRRVWLICIITRLLGSRSHNTADATGPERRWRVRHRLVEATVSHQCRRVRQLPCPPDTIFRGKDLAKTRLHGEKFHQTCFHRIQLLWTLHYASNSVMFVDKLSGLDISDLLVAALSVTVIVSLRFPLSTILGIAQHRLKQRISDVHARSYRNLAKLCTTVFVVVTVSSRNCILLYEGNRGHMKHMKR